MKQLARMERGKREALTLDPKNEDLRKEYTDFRREQIEFEFKEYELASDAYPTDMRWRFEMGRRMFSLSNFLGAIPVLQQAQERSQVPRRRRHFARAGVFQCQFSGRGRRHAGGSDQGLPAQRRRSIEGNVLLARPSARGKRNESRKPSPISARSPNGTSISKTFRRAWQAQADLPGASHAAQIAASRF